MTVVFEAFSVGDRLLISVNKKNCKQTVLNHSNFSLKLKKAL